MSPDIHLSRSVDNVEQKYLEISFSPTILQIEKLCHCDANEVCYLHR